MEIEKSSDLFEMDSSQIELGYEVDSFSSYEEPFFPSNVKIDCPFNSDSRWSASSSNMNEFIILKLNSSSILTSVTFGKYKKPFSGNLKLFKIYVGNNKSDFKKVLLANLKNDTSAENFKIDYQETNPFPCNYVKIKPITVWGADKFSFNIWYVKLVGVKDQKIVNFFEKYHLEKNKEIAIENYRNFLLENQDFNTIQAFKNMGFFTPQPNNFIEKLYELIVEKENFEESFNLIQELIEKGVFNDYVSNLPYKYNWTQIKYQEILRNENDYEKWVQNFISNGQESTNLFYQKFFKRFKTKSF